MYSRRGRKKKRAAALEIAVGVRSETDLMAENARIRAQLQQAQHGIDVFQEALSFSPSAGNREPQPQASVHPGPPAPLAGVGNVSGASCQ